MRVSLGMKLVLLVHYMQPAAVCCFNTALLIQIILLSKHHVSREIKDLQLANQIAAFIAREL